MDVPIGARVECADGPCGQSQYVVLNPVTEEITHLVVKDPEMFGIPRLVPLSLVADSTPKLIRLRCTREELRNEQAFMHYEYINPERPHLEYVADQYVFWPFATPEEDQMMSVKHEDIPLDELAIRRGASVRAADGHAGRVDEFLVDAECGRITHLVMREGHLWGQREVTIPAEAIDRIDDGSVHLKLTRDEVGRLPTIAIRRR